MTVLYGYNGGPIYEGDLIKCDDHYRWANRECYCGAKLGGDEE